MKDNSSNYNDEVSEGIITYVGRGDIRAVQAIINTGKCDLNYVTEGASSCLGVATARNDCNMMRLLIDNGADVNAGVGIKRLLSIAEANESEEMISLLGEMTSEK